MVANYPNIQRNNQHLRGFQLYLNCHHVLNSFFFMCPALHTILVQHNDSTLTEIYRAEKNKACEFHIVLYNLSSISCCTQQVIVHIVTQDV